MHPSRYFKDHTILVFQVLKFIGWWKWRANFYSISIWICDGRSKRIYFFNRIWEKSVSLAAHFSFKFELNVFSQRFTQVARCGISANTMIFNPKRRKEIVLALSNRSIQCLDIGSPFIYFILACIDFVKKRDTW